jgi:hypothetical protein
MPDWAMILVKCVLWFWVAYPSLAILLWLLRPSGNVQRLTCVIPAIAFVILAALEGWITP